MIDKNSFKYRKTIFVSSIRGEHIRLRNSNIIIEDKDGKIIGQESCYSIMIVFVFGDISITTAMIKAAKKYGFTFAFMTSMFRTECMIGNIREGQTVLRQRQYEYTGDEFANWIVRNKVRNQYSLLERLVIQHPEYPNILPELKVRIEELENAVFEPDTLRGLEGTFAGRYFRTIFYNEDWKGRKPRERKDFINASLDIGYTMLFNFVETIIRYYGFDLYKGFYHTDYWIRKSLVCDLIEPFRPIIDDVVATCIRQRKIVPGDFYNKNGNLELERKKWPEYQIYFADAVVARKEDIFDFVRKFYRSFANGKPIDEFPKFVL